MDGATIKQMLEERVKQVCQHLLPDGKEINGDWTTPSVQGVDSNTTSNNTRNLRVSFRNGLWVDHAIPSRKGNMVQLWMTARNVGFRLALAEAADFLGYTPPSDSSYDRKKKPPEPRADDLSKHLKPTKPGSRVWEWLTKDRKLSPNAIKAYGVCEGKYPYDKESKLCAVFPFIDQNGHLQMVKWRDPDDKSYIRTSTRSKKILFGIPAIPANQTEMYLTEGELDAMAMFDLGCPAVSVPFGAKEVSKEPGDKNSEWIEHSLDKWIDPHLAIYLATDSDEVGRVAAKSIARRLGLVKTHFINWPNGIKDANEFVLKGHGAKDFADGPLADAKNLDPSELKSAREFEKEIRECFWPSDEAALGDPLPFKENFPFRFRPGEVTVWTGYSKHGKTVLLNFMLVHLSRYGRKSCLCSLEMKPQKNLSNIIRQGLAKNKPDDEKEFDFALDWADRHFWIYDKVGSADPKEVLEVFAYAAKKYGISHFVIDSLMRLDIPEDEDARLKQLMNECADFAMKYDVHLHLVAHSKKPDANKPEESGWPSKHMVRGSVHVTNIAHNVVCVWRNKKKEKYVYEISIDECNNRRPKPAEVYAMPDATFAVLAQRENGEEPIADLFFDKDCWQYKEKPLETPFVYVR